LRISEEGLKSTKNSTDSNGSTISDGCQYLLGSEKFSEGVHEWKIRIDTWVGTWLLIGVTNEIPESETMSYNFRGSYGISSNNQFYQAASETSTSYSTPYWRLGDTIECTLNCDGHTFEIRNKSTSFYHNISLPSSKHSWYPHFVLYSINDSISILE